MSFMKLLLSSLILLCLATPALAADINAASCSRANVQTAINAAVDGDRVLVPAGTCTWTTSVTVVNKGITLQGAGIGVTTIVSGMSSGNVLDITLQAGDPTTNITGFTFDANNGGAFSFILLSGGGANQFRLHHFKLTNLRERGIFVAMDGLAVSGLIDHCTLEMLTTTGSKTIEIEGAGPTDSTPFGRAFALGSANFIFVEDNIFNFGDRNDGALDASGGARYVFRHNTVNNTNVEHHGADSGGFRGVHSFEIYENTFSNTAGGMRSLFFRSGTGVVFNNTWTGTYSNPDVSNYRSRPESFAPWGACDGSSPWDENQAGKAGYACLDQIGHVFTQNQGGSNSLQPLYFWNNTLNGIGITVGVSESSMANHLKEGRDFYSGTRRPGYTPFTYPHPLTSSTGGPPSPPTNLRVAP